MVLILMPMSKIKYSTCKRIQGLQNTGFNQSIMEFILSKPTNIIHSSQV
jgi:hypothetical protein